MIHRASIVVLSWALLLSPALAEGPSDSPAPKTSNVLDIIPEAAVAAVAIRDVADLTKRGDQFIAKTELTVPMRLSEAYKFVTNMLGLHNGLNENGSAALMTFKQEIEVDGLVLAVPVKDFDAMAGNFGLDPDRFAKGKVIDRGNEGTISYVRYLAVRGDHLLMGGSPKFVQIAATGRTLEMSLPKHDRETLAKDDIICYGNTRSIKDKWAEALTDLDAALAEFPSDEADALRRVAEASTELDYVAVGLRLDQGLGGTVLLQFDGEESRTVLTRLQGDQSSTSLAALPVGRVIAAQASAGDGEQSAAVARALLRFLLKTFSLKTDDIISAGHRSNVVGVFGEGWHRLNGSRTALYENEMPQRDGLFSLIAILETDDAEQFVADMTGLARFINASGLSLDEVVDAIDLRLIGKLVAELGDDQYRVRQLATTKLGLIGKAALPELEKAMTSDDAEVRFRARSVVQQINASLAAEREDLLKRDLLSRIKPNFIYFPEQETRAGRPIDIVRLQLQIDEAPAAARLRNLLGPEWSKMRMATVDNRVILLLGSNTAVFEQALANVQSGDAGLESGRIYALFRSRIAREQSVEFHVSLARAALLVDREVKPPTEPERGAASATSFGLSIEPQRIRFDLFAPYEEAKVVIKRMGW